MQAIIIEPPPSFTRPRETGIIYVHTYRSNESRLLISTSHLQYRVFSARGSIITKPTVTLTLTLRTSQCKDEGGDRSRTISFSRIISAKTLSAACLIIVGR